MLMNNDNKYKITIKTKYNVIILYADDYETQQLQEIFAQSYILDIQIDDLSKKSTLVKKKIM